MNESILFDDIINNLDLPWDWNAISERKIIYFQFILDNPQKRWNWAYLSQNLYIDIEHIINNSHLPWRWSEITYRRDVTFELVSNNLDKPWDWYQLSENSQFLFREYEYFNYVKEHLSVKKIQRQWLKSYYDPQYKICQKRLLREFSSLN